MGLGKTVEWCRSNISSYEFNSWVQYYHLYPWGQTDRLLAELITLSSKVARPIPTTDEILKVSRDVALRGYRYPEPVPQQSEEEMLELLKKHAQDHKPFVVNPKSEQH